MNKLEREKLKERFLIFCQKNNIRQNKIVASTKASKSTVAKWFYFNTDKIPDLPTLYWLKENYGLSIDNLLSDLKKAGS